MAKIEREINHHLSLEAAKTAAAELVNKVQSNFGSLISEIKWNDDKTVADVKGKGFTGNFKITDSSVKILIELGLLTSPFKGKVEEKIDEYAKNLENDPNADKQA